MQFSKTYFQNLPNSKKGYLFALASVLFSSFYALFYNKLTKMVEAESATLLLYAFSMLLALLPLWRVKLKKNLQKQPPPLLPNEPKPTVMKAYWKEITLIAFFTLFGNYLVSQSLLNLSAGMAQTLLRGDVFFAALFGWYFFREAITLRLLFCLVVAMLGIVVMRLTLFTDDPLQGTLLDYLFVCSGTMFYSLAQVVAKKIVHVVPPNQINAYRLILSNVMILVFFLFFPFTLHYSFLVLVLAFLSAFFGPICTRVCLIYGGKYLPLSNLFLITTCAPILTMLMQGVFLQQWLLWNEFFGAFLILTSVFLLHVRGFSPSQFISKYWRKYAMKK